MLGYEIFPLKKLCAVGADATAFRSRGPQQNILIMINWAEDERNTTGVDDARVISEQLIKIVQSTAEKQPTESENEGYVNYRILCVKLMIPLHLTKLVSIRFRSLSNEGKAGPEKQFGHNYPRLQQVKKMYDPKSVLNRWYPIVPAA